jgi:hypothetical protein
MIESIRVEAPDADEQATNDLRENCFQALESFVLRCPLEIKEFLPSILTTIRKYIEYDPNYTYDEYVGCP